MYCDVECDITNTKHFYNHIKRVTVAKVKKRIKNANFHFHINILPNTYHND